MGKKVLSATIDEKILEKWKEYTEEWCINSSQLIEKMLKDGEQRQLRDSINKN